MKYTLTVTAETAEELVALLAPAPASAPVQYASTPAPVQDAPVQSSEPHVSDDDDDDSAPADDSAPERDGRGFIWDERIHASSKKLNVDGTWRYRRNTPEETIKAVEAELVGQALDVPDFLKKDATIAVPTGDAPTATIAVPTGEAPVAAPAPAVTYEQVIAMLTTALQSGQVAPEDLPKFWNDCGVEGAHQMVGNQPAIDAASMKLAALQG